MAVIRFDFSTSSHHTESYSASGLVGSSCCWRIKHSLIAAFPSWFGNLSFRSLYSLHVLMATVSTVLLNQTAAVCFMFAADKKIFCHFYVQPDCWSHWTVGFSIHTESVSRLTVRWKSASSLWYSNNKLYRTQCNVVGSRYKAILKQIFNSPTQHCNIATGYLISVPRKKHCVFKHCCTNT